MALLATVVKFSSLCFALLITRQLMLTGVRTSVSMLGGYFLGVFASFVYLFITLLLIYGSDRLDAVIGGSLGTSVSYSFFGMLLGYLISNEKARNARKARGVSNTESNRPEQTYSRSSTQPNQVKSEYVLMSALKSVFARAGSSVSLYVAILILIVSGLFAGSFFSGPQNFQECMDDGITGRTLAELNYKKEGCYSRFPVLPLTAKGKNVVLSCIENGSHERISLTIGEKSFMNSMPLTTVSRDRSEIVFEAKNVGENEKDSILLKLDPLHGVLKAFVNGPGKDEIRYEFTCKGES